MYRFPLAAVHQNPDWDGCAEFRCVPEIQSVAEPEGGWGRPSMPLVPSENGLGVLKLMSEVKVFLGTPRVCGSHHTGESSVRATWQPSRPSVLQPHSPTTPAAAPLCLLFPCSLAAHCEFLQPVCPSSCRISLAGHATSDFTLHICLRACHVSPPQEGQALSTDKGDLPVHCYLPCTWNGSGHSAQT